MYRRGQNERAKGKGGFESRREKGERLSSWIAM